MATEKLGAVAALMNPGGVRANLEAGKITYGAANAICPFRNTLVVAEMTGEQVSKLLNDSKGNLIPSKGFTFALAGGGVRDIKIGGEPIDPAKLYKVTVNNFMAGGGDGLATLKDAKKTDTGLIDLDAFVEFLKANSPIPEQNEIRVSK
jgi:2',3'-cyclic-nucleotide 2'-phosphodiesterase (5'-nucleotidase family)